MLITSSLPAFAVDNHEYEFTNDQPSAGQNSQDQVLDDVSTNPFLRFFEMFDIGIVIVLLLNVAIGVIVYFDAKKCGISPASTWVLVSLLASGLGLVVYLITRYKIKQKYAS